MLKLELRNIPTCLIVIFLNAMNELEYFAILMDTDRCNQYQKQRTSDTSQVRYKSSAFKLNV